MEYCKHCNWEVTEDGINDECGPCIKEHEDAAAEADHAAEVYAEAKMDAHNNW